jgi:HEXXH motif-containing protein
MTSDAARTESSRVTGRGLVLPGESEPGRELAVAYTHYLADCCRRFLSIGPQLPPAMRAAHERCGLLVRRALEHNRGQVLRCFASAAVSAPLQCVALRDNLQSFAGRIDDAVAAMIPHLLLEMTLRGLVPPAQAFSWEHGAPRLRSATTGGELIPPAQASGLRFASDHISAIRDGAEVARLAVNRARLDLAGSAAFGFERRYRRVGNVASFATADGNPIAEFEAHPEKAGNHIDLGDHAEDEWIATLEASFALVERFLPGELAEMRLLLREIIPVGYDDVRHLSASYREVVGTIYLTLHPNVMTMTEAVIHEFQHNKMNLASYSVDYLNNAFHPLYRSPVRPDPRPLWGILLAVHAFLPVAELYRRMRDAGHPLAALPEFERRMAEIDLKNHEGMEMLRAHADLTPAGRVVMGELEELERSHLADRSARGLETKPTEAHVA